MTLNNNTADKILDTWDDLPVVDTIALPAYDLWFLVGRAAERLHPPTNRAHPERWTEDE
jgi:hypothetical protein